jgi:Domain of unknown function (DUF4149)
VSTSALLAFAFVSATLGGMIFFVSAVAPTVFRSLPQAEAGRFLRALFRNYYVVFATSSVLAMAAAMAAERGWEALLLAVVAAGFVAARQGLMPRINALRDRMLAGEGAAAPAFNALHRASVWLNMVQMAALLLVAVLLTR